MRRMPIPARHMPFLPRGCPRGMYAGLARLSPGCPPGGGRLHTCYSPVRRSPAGSPKAPPAAPRLACVKPAASVHPEPGSNSPLYVIFPIKIISILNCLSRPPRLVARAGSLEIDGDLDILPKSPCILLSGCLSDRRLVARHSGPVALCHCPLCCASGSPRLRLQNYIKTTPYANFLSKKFNKIFISCGKALAIKLLNKC